MTAPLTEEEIAQLYALAADAKERIEPLSVTEEILLGTYATRLLAERQHHQGRIAELEALVRKYARCVSCGGRGYTVFSVGDGDRTEVCTRCGGTDGHGATPRRNGDGLADDTVRAALTSGSATRTETEGRDG